MKKIFLLLMITCAIASCSDDDKNHNNNHYIGLEGTLSLLNVSGSIAGISDDFDEGTVTWKFNNDGTVTVVNNNTDEAKTDFFESGIYDYDMVENEDTPDMCEQVLVIDDITFGCKYINGNEMILSQEWADGYQLTFKKD